MSIGSHHEHLNPLRFDQLAGHQGRVRNNTEPSFYKLAPFVFTIIPSYPQGTGTVQILVDQIVIVTVLND